MQVRLLLGLVLATGFLVLPSHAYYSSEYLELADVQEIEEDEGFITFTGNVKNTHETQPFYVYGPHLTLKKERVAISVYEGSFDTYDLIQPGEIRAFSIQTDALQDEYDDFSIRFIGTEAMPMPESSFLIGELMLVEESLNFTKIGPDSTDAILGELFNDSNAALVNMSLQFRLFAAEGCLLGLAEPEEGAAAGMLYYQAVLPSETISFIAYSDVPLEQVGYWEHEIKFEIGEIKSIERVSEAEEVVADTLDVAKRAVWGGMDAPTAVKQATWGDIKAAIRP